MPDIAMCSNSACPLRSDCYRYRAHPTPHRQTYAHFEWQLKPVGLSPEYPVCKHRLDIYHRGDARPTAEVDAAWKSAGQETPNA